MHRPTTIAQLKIKKNEEKKKKNNVQKFIGKMSEQNEKLTQTGYLKLFVRHMQTFKIVASILTNSN